MNTQSPLIGVAELAAADDDDILVVDCRFALSDPDQGRRDYQQAHIPGAVHASLDDDLSDLSRQGLGRHPLPEASAFATSLGRWGWHPDVTLVAYDASHGAMAAARLWWLMRWMGVSARVLDGGLAAWTAAGQPVESGQVRREHTQVTVAFDPDQVLASAQLKSELAADDVRLLDARAGARFRGENEPIDPKAGHVPGALNRPFADNLESGGHMRTAASLRGAFQPLLGDRDPSRVVHMCGSGVTACHNLLAMEHAGLHGSRLYAPSWSGWVSDPANPVATGDA